MSAKFATAKDLETFKPTKPYYQLVPLSENNTKEDEQYCNGSPPLGFEPVVFQLQVHRSTTELYTQLPSNVKKYLGHSQNI